MKFTASQLQQIKGKLEQDARKAQQRRQEDPESLEWVEPECWKQYCGHGIGTMLYEQFSDEELLDMLRTEAAKLGHNPSKKDIFCVYRVFILRRFGKWPWALVAAGLKEPKRKRRGYRRNTNHDDEVNET